MKILYVSTSSGPLGGGELAAVSLARAQAQAGHTVVYWVSDNSNMDVMAGLFAEFGEVIRSHYVNSYDLPMRSLQAPFQSRTIRRIAQEFRQIAPEIIHLNKQNLEDGLDLVEACRLSALPRIGMIHLTQSASYFKVVGAQARDWISRRSLRRFGGPWVANPDNRYRELRTFLGDGPEVLEVPNGIALPVLEEIREKGTRKREELGISPKTLCVIAAGRVTYQKRPDRFLEAAVEVKQLGKPVRFFWIGSGDGDAEFDRAVVETGLADTVTRISWQDDVSPFFGLADIFLHPAEFEGLPYAVLEALGAGLPVVLSRNLLDDLPSLGTETCLAMDQPEFLRLFEDATFRAELGRRSRLLAEDQFALPSVAKSWERFYSNVVKNFL
jgi:glycosyltransferase involved in cell wall biosynthesis